MNTDLNMNCRKAEIFVEGRKRRRGESLEKESKARDKLKYVRGEIFINSHS